MKFRVSRIALFSILSAIPLAANDNDVDLSANDLTTVHPEAEIQDSPNLTASEDSAGDIVGFEENNDRKFGYNSDEHSDEDTNDLNTSENDETSEGSSDTRQAQHEEIDTFEDSNKNGQPSDDEEVIVQDGTDNSNEIEPTRENTDPDSNKQVDGDDDHNNAIIPNSKDRDKIQSDRLGSDENGETSNFVDDGDNDEMKRAIDIESDEIDNLKEKDLPSSSSSDNDSLDKAKIDEQRDTSSETQRKEEERSKPVMVDYANKSTGALILDKSKDFQGVSNLLVADKDKYAMIPCDKEGVKFVIIGLSEEILVKSIKLSSHEKFSSRTKRFEVLGSQTYPAMTEWEVLGTFDAKPWWKENTEQTFDLERPSWARYLTFRFLDHYGDEHYCAYTQIKVHGSTTQQGFHEMQQEAMEEAQAEAQAGTNSLVEDDVTIKTQENDCVEKSNEPGNAESDGTAEIIVNQDQRGHDVTEPGEKSQILDIDDTTNENDYIENLSPKIEIQDGDKGDEADIELPTLNKSESNISDEVDTDVSENVSSRSAVNESHLEDPDNTIVERNQNEDIDERIQTNSLEEGTSIESDGINKLNESTHLQASANNDEITKDGVQIVNEPPSSSSDTVKVDMKESSEDESVHPSASAVAGAVNSAINSVKKAAIMKDAVKGIHQIIKSKTSIEDDLTIEDETKEAQENKKTALDEDSAVLLKSVPETSVETVSVDLEEERGVTAESQILDKGTDQARSESSKQEESSKESIKSEILETSPTNVISNDTTAGETIKATQEMVSQLSSRFPSALCLDYLDFSEWKQKNMVSGNIKMKGSNTGEKQKQNEPIFVKLTDEIRGLEASQGIYEQYIQAATSCYQRVILDLGTELAMKEKEQEIRLKMLEEEMRNFRKKEETQTKQMNFRELMHSVKTILMTIIIPTLYQWHARIRDIGSDLLERLLGNEYIQQFLVLIGLYQQFICGFLLCYIFVLLTKEGPSKKESAVTDKRRSRRQQSKQKHNDGIMEVVITPSLQTDVEDDSL